MGALTLEFKCLKICCNVALMCVVFDFYFIMAVSKIPLWRIHWEHSALLDLYSTIERIWPGKFSLMKIFLSCSLNREFDHVTNNFACLHFSQCKVWPYSMDWLKFWTIKHMLFYNGVGHFAGISCCLLCKQLHYNLPLLSDKWIEIFNSHCQIKNWAG